MIAHDVRALLRSAYALASKEDEQGYCVAVALPHWRRLMMVVDEHVGDAE